MQVLADHSDDPQLPTQWSVLCYLYKSAQSFHTFITPNIVKICLLLNVSDVLRAESSLPRKGASRLPPEKTRQG